MVKLYIYEATRILLVHKENKKNDFIEWFFSSASPYTILMMSILHFFALTMVVHLLSMEGQKALGFLQKYLNLCSEDERRSYRFGTTWGWVFNDRIFILG